MSTQKHTPEEIAEAIAVLLETEGLPDDTYDALTWYVIDLLRQTGYITSELVRSSLAQVMRQAAPDKP